MSTYRKFDKYRQRADFLSDMEYGIDSPANKWIVTGTGTPVSTAGGDGRIVTTTAAANDTAFIQRGIISAATKCEPVTIVDGRKAHIVASVSSAVLGDFGLLLGFAGAAADPAADADRAVLRFEPGVGFIAQVGANKQVIAANYVFDDLVVENQIDLEVYFDGTDHFQFFAGRKRVAKIIAGAADFSGAMSPTFGVMNLGTAVARTATLNLLGYAVQRAPSVY